MNTLKAVKRLLDIVDRLPCDSEGRTVLWGDYVEDDQGQRWRVHAIKACRFIEVDNEQGSRFWRAAERYRKVENWRKRGICDDSRDD